MELSDSTLNAARDDTRYRRRGSRRVAILCWFALFAEGYDIGVMGAILPVLMVDSRWALSPLMLGALGSAALVGMLFGGGLVGMLSDLHGRKNAFLACLVTFSLAMGGAAWAPTPSWFAAFRFISGLGVGGIIPVAAALTTEFAPRSSGNVHFASMYSGYSLGILTAALVAVFALPEPGWRFVVALGLVPLLLVPVAAVFMPASVEQLMGKGKLVEAARIAAAFGIEVPAPTPGERTVSVAARWRNGLRAMFGRGARRATFGFWMTYFFGMVLVYGLNTWLPQIMRNSGYELGPSLLFMAVFALASAGGGILLGCIADRIGRKITIACGFCFGSLAILALAHKSPMPVTYVLVALAGIGTVACSVVVTAFAATYFPPAHRSTAVGLCISFSRFGALAGPLLGGAIASLEAPPSVNFLAFSAVAAAAAASILCVPRRLPAS